MSKPDNNQDITQAYVQEHFLYCPVSGQVVHKTAKVKAKVGDRAGSRSKCNSRYLRIHGKKYLEHRVVWLYVTGEWPINEIDHKDHDRTNNRWENLREVTHAVNMKNKPRYASNSTGHSGISIDKRCGKYRAYLSIDKKPKSLGYFATLAEAIAARTLALQQTEGYHANHGR
mgnify:FL=1